MFSGIRYILGYTDETDTAQDSPANQPNSATAPATVLEQTLNAAATKFTEQLLPQQSSIEQLQSSSHQLLPSIKEQHEENESKKQASLDEAVEAIQLQAPDDEDLFVADSWELLDLVEDAGEDKPVTKTGRSSSVQKDATSTGLQKSTSGILKSSSASVSDTSCQQSRHKPKVSFETPDLVNSKQEIEKTKGTNVVTSSSKKGKSKENKRNSRVNVGECKTEKQQAVPSDAGSAKVDYRTEKPGNVSNPIKKLNEENPSLIVGTRTTETTPFEMTVAKPIKVTTLNYAKALSAKPKSDVAKKMDKAKMTVGQTVEENVKEEAANKPMKRNRPTSTSSWSSSDEIETVEQQCAAPAENDASLEQPGANWCIDDDDDKQSLASSGFSDCDYGYGGINDYVMRPKKAGTRRNRTQSGSSGSFRALKVARGHSTKHMGAVSGEGSSTQAECSKVLVKKSLGSKASVDSSPSAKTCRSKKKLILTTPSKATNVSDFLKLQGVDKVAKTQSSKFLEPKSPKQLQQSPASSSNDSNEIPEMDESWYVTPPPCFTGANKKSFNSKVEQQPKVVDAARENALIEHPSVYIAGSSKSVADGRASASRIKKALRKPLSNIDLASKKAWSNKFKKLVDDWELDGQEEGDSDFDNMFEPAKKKKSKGKKRLQKLESQKVKPASGHLPVDADTDSDEQCIEIADDLKEDLIEGPNSVELISIRSLSMENLQNIENEEVNSFGKGDNDSDENSGKPQKRQATKVRPIEPERRPGWQLKKQRSKRRPLALLNLDKRQSTEAKSTKATPPNVKGESPDSLSSSSRSTPTFMDRIGSSIVANLNNLTSGLVSSGASNSCSPASSSSPLVDGSERAQQTVTTRSKEHYVSGLNSRKQLSRGSLKRQNVTAQQANMQRRPDRRLKMFATPNGSSVNRKVHANIH